MSQNQKGGDNELQSQGVPRGQKQGYEDWAKSPDTCCRQITAAMTVNLMCQLDWPQGCPDSR